MNIKKRKNRILVSALALSLMVSSPAHADLILDAPDLSGTVTAETAPAEIESTTQAETSAPLPVENGGIITNDRPSMLVNEQETTAAAAASFEAPVPEAPMPEETSAVSSETVVGPVLTDVPAIGGEAPAETESAPEETMQAASEEAVTAEGPSLADTPMGPEQPAAEAQTEAAPAAEAPSVQGPSSASPASGQNVRVSLGFEIASPAHQKSGLKVARGSVKLSDGSWQSFSYEDSIRFPYYKVMYHGTDGNGTSSLVVAATAKKFGSAYTSDGEIKKELYLNASDCTVTNYIDIPTTNPTRQQIVRTALSLLGREYRYGANGPDAFDCSGFVKYVMSAVGVDVPRTSTSFLSMNGQISVSELRPGDVLARSGHCGIYIGNDIFIHASDSGIGVVAESLSVYNTSNKFTNCINVVGD